jgi:hypothetical protein
MVVIGLLVIDSMFWTAVWYLYSFTDQVHVVAFESMFQTAMWTNSMIILGYLGFQTLAGGLSRNVTTSAQQLVSSLFVKKDEKIDQTITIHTPKSEHFDDIP